MATEPFVNSQAPTLAHVRELCRNKSLTDLKHQCDFVVFALSRRDDAFDHLVRIARTGKARDVKQSAFFWLGQSKDPRAAEFFAEALGRPHD